MREKPTQTRAVLSGCASSVMEPQEMCIFLLEIFCPYFCWKLYRLQHTYGKQFLFTYLSSINITGYYNRIPKVINNTKFS